MSASYAGAVAAIKLRFASEWTNTQIAYQNELPSQWPPTTLGPGGFPTVQPHVYFELLGGENVIHGAGTPGAMTWVHSGWIKVHVFVPSNSGTAEVTALATKAGEIFRTKKFYDTVSPGCYVRTWEPRVDGGGNADHDGNLYRVTMTCRFEYWHRGWACLHTLKLAAHPKIGWDSASWTPTPAKKYITWSRSMQPKAGWFGARPRLTAHYCTMSATS